MTARLKAATLILSFSLGLTGCAPSQLFSCIDRHCFIADWTNHHSCVSCCHGNCQHAQPMVEHEMLVLGNQPTSQAPIK
ncbi:MAG: hypothetical protein L0228_11315 [Planctomycetes bacterium]|nr:hypothetical protein [Planctomycetota bacterium]